MPIGTYSYKPKTFDQIKIFDCEEFILGLLKDICSESTNPLLNNAIINYENSVNLADLNNTNSDQKLLVAFSLNSQDPRNVNLVSKTNDDGRNIKVVYQIGLAGLIDSISSIELLRATEEIITACTNNWNGTSGQPTPYTLTLSNGKTLVSNLTTNTSDTFAGIQIAQEDGGQQNYLTASINIVFSIVNNT